MEDGEWGYLYTDTRTRDDTEIRGGNEATAMLQKSGAKGESFLVILTLITTEGTLDKNMYAEC